MVRQPASFDNLLYIALLAMVLDHLSFVFPSHAEPLRAIGRIAFPLFAWSLGASLANKSAPPWQMLARMHTAALLSIPLWLAIAPTATALNIFYTLMLAVLLIVCLETSWGMRLEHRVAAWLLVCYGAPLVDYGTGGVLLPVAFYAWHKRQTLPGFLWIAALVGWISIAYGDHALAWIALPLGFAVWQIPRTLARLHPGMFYYAYVGHLVMIAFVVLLKRAPHS